MPSQDNELDALLKGLTEEDDDEAIGGGDTDQQSPDIDSVSGMTEEEIAKLLAVGEEDARQEPPAQEISALDEDVLGMLEDIDGDDDLQEIQDLLQKSDNNEVIDTEAQEPEAEENPADRLLADIENGSESQVLDSKQQKELEKKHRKEEKLAKKAAKKAEKEAAKAAKAEKSGKGKKGQAASAAAPKQGAAVSQNDLLFDKSLLDDIVSGGQTNTELKQEKNIVPDENGIVELDTEAVDEIIPDITKNAEKAAEQIPGQKKKGFFAKVVDFLMEEDDEDEKTGNEDIQLSQENQDILMELDKEKASEGKGKKDKKKKKEKKKKEPKPAKPKKEKKPKEEKPKDEEPYVPGKKLTLKKVLPIVLLGATVGAAIFIFVNVSVDFADKQVARNAYGKGDYQTCYTYLFGKELNETEEVMYGKSESILYICLWYREYEMYADSGSEVQALDCLIRSVQDYPILYEYASKWNAAGDVYEVYAQMLNILSEKYGLTEGQALEIAAIKSDLEYTRVVTALAEGKPYGYWNQPMNDVQSVEEEGLRDELPEEAEIGSGGFVDNQ